MPTDLIQFQLKGNVSTNVQVDAKTWSGVKQNYQK
jgi:hypothetical protein